MLPPQETLPEVFVSGGLRWQSVRGLRALLEEGWPPAEAASRTLRATCDRAVEEIEIPSAGRRLVVKTFRGGSPVRRALEALAGSRAGREMLSLLTAASKGVAAAKPLAVGEGPGGLSVIVLEPGPGTDLGSAFESAGRAPGPGDVEAFASFVRSAHDRGVSHSDPHPGNILVTPGTPPGFMLLDGRSMRFGPALTLKERIRNLALLNLYFFIRASRHARFRFLRACLPVRGREEAAEAAAEVERRTAALAAGAWRKAAARCMGDNSRFRAAACGGIRSHVRRRPEAEAALDAVASLFEPGGKTLKDSRGAHSSIRDLPGGFRAFCKLYRPRSLSERLLGLFRRPRAERAMLMSYAFELRGLPVAAPLLAASAGRFGPGESVLVSEELRGAALDAALKSLDPAGRAAAIAAFARVAADMHARGAGHRDLKASNVLVGPGGEIRLCDLDGASVHRRVPAGKRGRDLARALRTLLSDCGASAAEAAAFEAAYRRRAGGRN